MQSPPEQMVREPVGPQGEACADCGAALAADQRYCINCGRRRADPRVPLPAAVAEPAGSKPPAAVPPDGRPSDVSPLGAVLGVALLGGMLLIGVLIGRGGNDDETPAPVIQVGERPAASTTTTTADEGSGAADGAAITSDWPSGTEGFTVELSTVSKAGATEESIDGVRSSAEAQGAEDVGVLDSDLYPTLPPGNYVIYSGVYDTRSEAADGLKPVESSFPAAQVVEVGTSTTSEDEAAP